jgi:hypothetical protein
MDKIQFFNPLDKQNLGKSIVEALLKGPELPLSSVEKFVGAGVYAIYYRGSFVHYQSLSKINRETGLLPIYVGKADPSGKRKSTKIVSSLDSNALTKRLRMHAKSIQAASSTLNIEDFSYRCLVVDDIWISLGESLVIHKYKPLWNQVLEGFGNNDPGSGRSKGKKSSWDALHPGRAHEKKYGQPSLKGLDEIIATIQNHFLSTLDD